MTLKVQLLVSEWCAPCRGAEEVWQQIAQKKAIAFEVLDVGQREGRAIVANLGVKTVPATVIDGILKHVGVPTTREAMEFVAAAPDKAAGMARYVGMTLAPSSRWRSQRRRSILRLPDPRWFSAAASRAMRRGAQPPCTSSGWASSPSSSSDSGNTCCHDSPALPSAGDASRGYNRGWRTRAPCCCWPASPSTSAQLHSSVECWPGRPLRYSLRASHRYCVDCS